jgi:glycosyltransferase A (GT-A) superfamily protein (DUF2064 family)
LKIAVAIFVKTPGYSKIKTRLAASIGAGKAEDFYLQALKAIESVAFELKKSLLQIDPLWAVAESEALTHHLWQSLDRIYQGEGDLGQRLASIHNQLFERYDLIYFMGADSPHLEAPFLLRAIEDFCKNSRSSFQLGVADDGGFYLLGMKKKIPGSIWRSVTYSADSTAFELREKILSIGEVIEVQKDFDVDTIEDLLKYKNEKWDKLNLNQEQIELIQWVRKNF